MSSTTPPVADDATDTPSDLHGPALKQWRREQRKRLLDARLHAGGPLRRMWNTAITEQLHSILPDAAGTTFGVYWPFKGEYAIRPLMRELFNRGGCPALPHVVQARQPLEFLRWHPGAEMVRGVYDIPVPKDASAVTPDVLIVPLVGFDGAGYRLGYGGGYYDRTIASMLHRPLLIGVGYEISRLPTIYPQAHDISMDYVVTEEGVQDCR